MLRARPQRTIGTSTALYAAAALIVAATLSVFSVRDVRELRRR
jgi:hypothetical protein